MAQVERKREVGLIPRLAAGLALNHIVPNQGLLEFTVGIARIYQRSGVQRLVRKSGLLRLLPGSLADMEGSMPAVSDKYFKAKGQTVTPRGAVKTRVALLSGCVMPLFSGSEMEAVVRVLNRNGCEVVVPEGQGCCGAIHSHVGDLETTQVYGSAQHRCLRRCRRRCGRGGVSGLRVENERVRPPAEKRHRLC